MPEKKVQVFAVALFTCGFLLSAYVIYTILSYAITTGQWHEINWRKAAILGALGGCLVWLAQSSSRMFQAKFANPVPQVRSTFSGPISWALVGAVSSVLSDLGRRCF